ncbi:YIP1 family protein [Deinococcus sp. Leaf326]|jgi:hypothetical protein|uniref:YIP1 family protein n=1 Tax=Deinococcus sp. Leaf326 TaxID=1736338 RepID=UPI0006FFDC45|nr:YIP1 family protein [Deinococcus sp. Leaf326]KQR35173.1 hypothetical protein ASF71_16460 [Deinococcus sp. Leaf326]
MTLTATLIDSSAHLDLIRRTPRRLLWGVFAAYGLTALITALVQSGGLAPNLRLGLLTLSTLSGLLAGALVLGLYPLVFTFLSRKLGGVGEESDVPQIRSVTALAMIPTLITTLLAAVSGFGPITLLGGLLSTVVFIYALSLANGTDMLAAMKHTFLIWGVLLGLLILLNIVIKAGS